MADPLSVAASVAGVVSVGLEIAKGLYKLADGIGSAGREVRSLASEVNTISRLFGRVRTQLLNKSSHKHHQSDLIEDVLEICDQILDPLRQLQQRLSPLLVRFLDSPTKLRCFALRVQWLFQVKDKMMWLRGVLNAQHQVLDTILELVILETTEIRSTQNLKYEHTLACSSSLTGHSILQASLDMSLHGVKRALQDDRQALEPSAPVNRSPAMLYPPINQTQAPSTELISPRADIEQEEEHTLVLLGAPQVSVTPQDAEVEVLTEEAEYEFDEKIQIVALEVSEHIRVVSRKVVKRGTNAMRDDDNTKSGISSHSNNITAQVDGDGTHVPSDDHLSNVDIESPPTLSNCLSITFHNHDGKRYEVPRRRISTWLVSLRDLESSNFH